MKDSPGTNPAWRHPKAAAPAASAQQDVRIAHVHGRTGALEAYGKQPQVGLRMGLEYARGGGMAVKGRRIEKAAQGLTCLAALRSPDGWLLWLGLLFLLSMYYFPTGVVVELRSSRAGA